jgi:hypothetical protein
MNTANLQLEGLYLALAALTDLLASKGLVSREEIDGAFESAEQTALNDYRADELRPANREAVAFPSRFLRLANKPASRGVAPGFSELARLVGQLKDDASMGLGAPGRRRTGLRPDVRLPRRSQAAWVSTSAGHAGC